MRNLASVLVSNGEGGFIRPPGQSTYASPWIRYVRSAGQAPAVAPPLSLEEPWLKVTEAYVFRRRTLVDRGVDRIGKVYEVYSSQAGGRPEWALAPTGVPGSPAAITPAVTASCRVGLDSWADPLGTLQRMWTTMGPRRAAAEPASGTGAPTPETPAGVTETASA